MGETQPIAQINKFKRVQQFETCRTDKLDASVPNVLQNTLVHDDAPPYQIFAENNSTLFKVWDFFFLGGREGGQRARGDGGGI